MAMGPQWALQKGPPGLSAEPSSEASSADHLPMPSAKHQAHSQLPFALIQLTKSLIWAS